MVCTYMYIYIWSFFTHRATQLREEILCNCSRNQEVAHKSSSLFAFILNWQCLRTVNILYTVCNLANCAVCMFADRSKSYWVTDTCCNARYPSRKMAGVYVMIFLLSHGGVAGFYFSFLTTCVCIGIT